MISLHDPWWPFWLKEAGVDVASEAARPRAGIRMDCQATEGAVAMAGQGVAMLTPFFWRNDLAESPGLSARSPRLRAAATPIGWSRPGAAATSPRSSDFANG
jgi:hypothetical protein